MAMTASLIAVEADVQLQYCCFLPLQFQAAMILLKVDELTSVKGLKVLQVLHAQDVRQRMQVACDALYSTGSSHIYRLDMHACGCVGVWMCMAEQHDAAMNDCCADIPEPFCQRQGHLSGPVISAASACLRVSSLPDQFFAIAELFAETPRQ